MGGIRKFKHGRKHRKQGEKNERGTYAEISKQNIGFESYYKAQNIVSEAEWITFLESLRQDLPTAFRISACNEKEASALLKFVEGHFFKNLINPDNPEEQKKKPFCLPWYPKNLGWQVPISRKDIRRSETYFKLHNFLMSETGSGNISRQEVVSMIPPLVLDVKPHHKVLDMCAAPGSKTAQLIEMMHADDNTPTGIVVANDVDNSRCYMLVHQAKRLNSPCTIITNHDASVLPNLLISNPEGVEELLKYDRILCDVPCTGDGTLRKNPDIWPKWNPSNANNLHGVQVRIVKRASELLTVGGRIVYSTCSLNPVENEAVMHRIIAESEGALELEDVSGSLPGLIYNPGITSWVVSSKELEIYKTFDEVPEGLHNQIRPHMFPPKPEEVEKFNLHRCIRILPHQQDTGGFFVAVLKKLSNLPWESTKLSEELNQEGPNKKSSCPQPKRRKIQGYREDPFVFFNNDEPVWPIIKDFYGISDELRIQCLLTRCHVGKRKNIYIVTPAVHDIISKNQEKIKLINAGVKVFSRCDNKNTSSCFRLANEGLPNILPYLGKTRRVEVKKDDLVKMLINNETKTSTETTLLHPDTQEHLKTISQGSCVLEYRGDEGLNLDLVGWRGTCSVRPYVSPPDCVHYVRVLGGDTSVFEKNKFKLREEEEGSYQVPDNIEDNILNEESSGDEDSSDKNGRDDQSFSNSTNLVETMSVDVT